MLERFTPDIYSDRDANHALSMIPDKEYVLGEGELSPSSLEGKARIWSHPPRMLHEVQEIVKNSGHLHLLPFIMGTYHMKSREMNMNDISILSDPVTAYMAFNGNLDKIGLPLRGLYFIGRRNWWRHESIHARHHLQMGNFLYNRDNPHRLSQSEDYFYTRLRLDEAAETIHESGVEELLTRWQSLKESRGVREKAAASMATLLYIEYAPFTGVRNMFIDAKEKSLDLVPQNNIRIPAKLASLAAIIAAPIILDNETEWQNHVGELIDSITPLTTSQVDSLITRTLAYIDVAAFSAMFSSKEKGALRGHDENASKASTREYKFPYTYNPATSISRSIGFIRYISRVWDEIPNYRVLQSARQGEQLKREIETRIDDKLDDKQADFTMSVVDDALTPMQQANRSAFPQQVYVKGMFVPAMYLKLSDLYTKA